MDGDPAARRPVGPARDRDLSVPGGRILHDWREVHTRALAYLAALGLDPQEDAPLAARAVERALTQPWERAGDALSETLRALRQLVQEERPGTAPPEGAPDGFLAWRLARALGGRSPWSDTPGRRAEAAPRDRLLRPIPELSPPAMGSEPDRRRLPRRLLCRRRNRAPAAPPGRARHCCR